MAAPSTALDVENEAAIADTWMKPFHSSTHILQLNAAFGDAKAVASARSIVSVDESLSIHERSTATRVSGRWGMSR